MVIVEPLHAAVESAVIAGVRGFRPHIKVHAVVDQDPCVRRRMIALSPIKPNYLGIARKTLAIVFVFMYLPWKIIEGASPC
jgi:hypothetical protein